MTLNDLKPDFEVTAFFEIEHLGPDWFYGTCSIRLRIGLSGPSPT